MSNFCTNSSTWRGSRGGVSRAAGSPVSSSVQSVPSYLSSAMTRQYTGCLSPMSTVNTSCSGFSSNLAWMLTIGVVALSSPLLPPLPSDR